MEIWNETNEPMKLINGTKQNSVNWKSRREGGEGRESGKPRKFL